MKNNKELPLFLQNDKTKEIFKIVIDCLPKGTNGYLIGGSVRNAIFYKYFNKVSPQRDYDLLLIGDKDKFFNNLRKAGFVYGKIRRKHEVVLKMKRIPKPQHIHNDYLYLDIHISDNNSVLNNLANHSNFTINGSALSIKDIFKKDWFKKLISLPGSLNDLKNKRLKVNKTTHPADLFACLRFMHLGFKQPPREDIDNLLKELSNIPKWRFDKNITKLFNYVGGEERARKLLKKLKVKEDIFNFKTIKKL